MNPLRAERPGLAQRARGCLVVVAATLAAVAVLGFVVYELRAPLLTRESAGCCITRTSLEPADANRRAEWGGARPRGRDGGSVCGRVRAGRCPDPHTGAGGHRRVAGAGLDVGTQLERRLDYLEALGVPREAITVLQRPVESTHAEAELIAEWAEAREIERIIVVTDGYHTSRSRLVFARVLRDRPTEVLVRPSSTSRFNAATWWHGRSDLRDGLFELQKYVYYRFAYLLRLTP